MHFALCLKALGIVRGGSTLGRVMVKVKIPQHAAMTEEELEAPTRKQNALPADLREPGSAPAGYSTTKVPKADIDALLKKKERESDHDTGSGLRFAVAEDEIERFERDLRRSRETVPAPAENSAEGDPKKTAQR